MLEKQLDDFDSVLLAGDVQRSEPVQGTGIYISLNDETKQNKTKQNKIRNMIRCADE